MGRRGHRGMASDNTSLEPVFIIKKGEGGGSVRKIVMLQISYFYLFLL